MRTDLGRSARGHGGDAAARPALLAALLTMVLAHGTAGAAQLRELLPRLPWAQVRALVAARRGPYDPAGPAAEGSAAARRQDDRLHSHDHAAEGCRELVRQDSAGPHTHGAGARPRLSVPVP